MVKSRITIRSAEQVIISLLIGLLLLFHPNANINNRHFGFFDSYSPLNKSKLHSADLFTVESAKTAKTDKAGRAKPASLKKPTDLYHNFGIDIILIDTLTLPAIVLCLVLLVVGSISQHSSRPAYSTISRAPPLHIFVS